jgi:hypothetical protein
MKRFLMLCALGSIALCGSDALSQSRDLGARRLILDDGATGRLTISYAGPGDGTLVIPNGGGSLSPIGTITNATLAWTGLTWVQNANLLADPTVGGIIVNGGINNTSDGITNAGPITGATTIDATSVNVTDGFTITGAAAAGEYLRGNGTNFVSSPIMAADLPAGSNNYIINGTTPQTADFNISGDGTIGDDLTVNGLIALPATTATDGQIRLGGQRFMHAQANGTYLGASAGNLTITGYNVGVGPFALTSGTTGGYNVAVGQSAMQATTTGNFNTAVGMQSLAANLGGWNSTAIGNSALQSSTSGSNTAVGSKTLRALAGGAYNTAIGEDALVWMTSGFYNSAVGHQALVNNQGNGNVGVGTYAMSAVTTGINNTGIGFLANVTSGGTINSTAIGYLSLATENNQVVLGNDAVTEVLTFGNINAPSATLSALSVSTSPGDKYAGVVTTNDASADNIETISNSLLTANSMVVVTLNTELGTTYIINAVPGAGTMDVKFSTNVADGSKLTYMIIN